MEMFELYLNIELPAQRTTETTKQDRELNWIAEREHFRKL